MFDFSKTLKIGTRGSALALTQTEMVKAALARAWPDLQVETVVIKTSGDWRPEDGEAALPSDGGGKAHFAKEIEEALLDGRIDAAVHSMKDMDSVLPEGLVIRHMLPREDARDALLFRDRGAACGPADLPAGAVVGTVSPRRQVFMLQKNLDLAFVPLRGNVETRLEKLRGSLAGGHDIDVTVLAVAGLKRLGLQDEIDVILEPNEMLPAAGQGAVGIEIKSFDNNILAIFDQINCRETLLCVAAERACVAALNGSCHTAVGAHAILDKGAMILHVQLDNFERLEARGFVQNISQAQEMGRALGLKLKDKNGV